MKKYLLPLLLLLAAPALAAQQEITAVPASPVLPSIGALKDAVNLRLADIDENFDEIYSAVGTRPWVIQATAPADTTLAWFDTDQVVDAVVLKIHNGERWVPQAIGEGGSYTLPTAAADTLGGVKVGARLTITDGVLSADVQTGNGSATYPSAAGVANWGGSAWGTSYTVGTSANNLVQLNASAQLPAVSGALLTSSFTGTLLSTQTTLSGAIQTIGTELDGQDELIFGGEFTETAGTGTVTVTLDYPVTSETYGPGWSADTEGTMRKDIYAILHAGDTDDDGMADKLDLTSAGFVNVNSSGVISSVKEKEYIGWSVVNSDTDTAVADGKLGAAVPAGMNGMNLVDFTCSVADLNSAASGATTVVLRRVRGGTAVDMTSRGVTIGYNEYTASDEVIDTSNDDLATGDNLYVDINAVTTVAQKGLHCTATFEAP